MMYICVCVCYPSSCGGPRKCIRRRTQIMHIRMLLRVVQYNDIYADYIHVISCIFNYNSELSRRYFCFHVYLCMYIYIYLCIYIYIYVYIYIYNPIQSNPICAMKQRHANTQMCTRLIEGVNYVFLGRLT